MPDGLDDGGARHRAPRRSVGAPAHPTVVVAAPVLLLASLKQRFEFSS
jgi:hypothetical protein